MSENEYLVSQKEAADFLNVSTKSISRYRKRGLPYKLILNPVTGKQEVRFCRADLARWDEGRQLLATYGRDGEEMAAGDNRPPVGSGRSATVAPPAGSYLDELLAAYREQIELLREQLEDMRAQLARRDRQIDDLMRLMVGRQLEYMPLAEEEQPLHASETPAISPSLELFQSITLPDISPPAPRPELEQAAVEPAASLAADQGTGKVFTREQLTASIDRLRQKGKSFEEIALGLNRIGAATLSGLPDWTVTEVQSLLSPLLGDQPLTLAGKGGL